MPDCQISNTCSVLQARIVVAENLPDDHCYQNLMRLFSTAGRYVSVGQNKVHHFSFSVSVMRI
jgi:hypothetical protein